jgi:hypothetical protein
MSVMWLTVFNWCEAGFWASLGVFVALRSGRFDPRLRRTLRTGACLLALFGLSDVIEAFTGAWWRPPGLLVLKATCLAGLLAIGLRCFRIHRDLRVDDEGADCSFEITSESPTDGQKSRVSE